MDRDTARLLLLGLGAVVMLGMIIWSRYKQKLLDFLHRRKEFEDLGLHDTGEQEAPPEQDDDDLFDSLSYRGRKDGGTTRKEPSFSGGGLGKDGAEEDSLFAAEPEPAPAATLGAPPFIQISVVASRGNPFKGEELRDALLDLDLIHGDMDIFHRYDRQFKQTLFSVATLVEPGTFPMDDMENFECPGIILFFQTARVSDPLSVYDDLIHTAHELAIRLNGIEWDESRQPLSAAKIAETRTLLKNTGKDPL
jgi:cell division protein ZipA